MNIPIFQYDSLFRSKEVIANDRARLQGHSLENLVITEIGERKALIRHG